MKIRSVVREDEDQLYGLIAQLEGNAVDRGAFAQVVQENLNQPHIYYFAAEENGSLQGFVSVHIQKLLHHAALIAEIQELVVSDHARRQGIGRLLFRQAAELSRSLGCLQLEVCCNQRRIASHRFYEAQGMTCRHYKFCLPLKPSEKD